MRSATLRVLFVLLLVGQLPALPQAGAEPRGEDQWLELELRGWAPTLSGSARSTANGGTATDVDYDETLGMDTRENFYWPRATFHFAENHRLVASWLHVQYGGDTTVSRQFSFGGTTFTAGEGIHSELELTELTGGYQYDLLKFSRLSANLNLQVHVLDLEAKVRGNTLGSVREQITAPIPTIGGGLRLWPWEWLKVSGDFNIFKASASGFEGELIDSEAMLVISPWNWIGLGAGYRYWRGLARDTDSNDRIDWLQQGPFFTIVLRPF